MINTASFSPSTSKTGGYYAILITGETVTCDDNIGNISVWRNGADVTGEYSVSDIESALTDLANQS